MKGNNNHLSHHVRSAHELFKTLITVHHFNVYLLGKGIHRKLNYRKVKCFCLKMHPVATAANLLHWFQI